MIMKANKQIGFIYKNNESIDKILKDGDVIFERGFLREKTSTTLPITFGGVGKDLKDYKIYGNTKQQILPDGYTQVDYIESSGNQYIDTGVNADTNLRVVLDMAYTNPTGPNQNVGAIKLVSGLGNARYHLLTGANSTVALWVNDSNNVLGTIDTNRHYYDLDVPNGKAIFDSTTINIPTNINDSGLNFWLFGRNSTSTIYLSKVKQWTCKMYYSNVLVRDFIPCYRNSDNEVGLYDLVNNVFYTNEGTGTFTYGSIAPTPDAPIEIVSCGDRTKNLFDKDTINFGYRLDNFGVLYQDETYFTSDYIKVNSNTIYCTNVSPTAYKRICEYDSNKNFIAYSAHANISTITTTDTTKYIRFAGLLTELDTTMFEEGSTATSYEPYGYKIPVNVRSDNLFDKDDINMENNKHLTSDGSYFDNSNFKTTDYIPIKSSIIYNLSPYRNYRAYECFYDENKTFISSIQIKNINNTFTTPSNAKFIRLSVRKTDNDGLMLVEGSTAPTKYQPYYNATTNIYLEEPLRKIDGYSDYIDFINGKVVRNIDEIALDGTENWNGVQDYQSSTTMASKNGTFSVIRRMNKINNLISNKFNVQKNDNISDNITAQSNLKNAHFCIRKINPDRIYFKWENWQGKTGNEVKEIVTLEPITINYTLETPTEEDIELPNIPAIDGNNTLNIETEITPSQVYIKYKSNN